MTAIYFSGLYVDPSNNFNHGRELMVFDGSGVSLAKDLTTGIFGTFASAAQTSDPREITSFRGKLYFSSALGGGGNPEDFRTLVEFDPATGLTREVIGDRNIAAPGLPAERADGDELFMPRIDLSYLNPKELTVVGGKLYFSGLYVSPTGVSSGRELMVFDGTTASLAVDLTSAVYGTSIPSSTSSDPRDITAFNGKLYFSSAFGLSGTEHFRTLVEFDPATGLAREIISNRNVGPGMPAERADGDELFMPDIDFSYVNPKELTVVGDKLYFSGHFRSPTGVSSGRELMVFDGTTASLAVDLTSAVYGTNIPSSSSSDPREIIGFNGKLYFSSAYGLNGTEDFRTLVEFDPATGLAREIISNRYLGPGMPAERADGDELFMPHLDFNYVNPKELTVVGGKLYFSGHYLSPTGASSGRELMVFDGTTASLASDLTQGLYGPTIAASRSSDPRDLTVANGKLYFSSASAGSGPEDFRTLVEYDPATGDVREVVNDIPGAIFSFLPERNDGDETFVPRVDVGYIAPTNLVAVATTGDDDFLGTSAPDVTDLKSGNDIYDAGAGNDTVTGGAGNDRIDGGDGADRLSGDSPPLSAIALNPGATTNQAAQAALNFSSAPLAFTVEMLVRLTATPPGGAALFSYASVTSDNEFLIYGHTGGNVVVNIRGLEYATTIPTSSLLTTELRRLSVSYDAANGALRVYLDGSLQFAGTHPATGALASSGFLMLGQEQDVLGGALDPTQAAHSIIGDVRVFTVVRSATEILAAANEPLVDQSNVPGLVFNWLADPSTPTIMEDYVGSTDLAIVNGAAIVDVAPAGNDTITGGSGADTVDGGIGNDTFIVLAGDLVSGDTIDGGANSDTVRIDGGGTIDLTLLSLSNIENITFTGAAGTNVTVTAAQAALISSAAGTMDIVTISGNSPTNTALALQLLNAGVEQVRWTSSAYGSATVLPDPENATRFIVTYIDNNLTRPFDFLRTTYDASGNRVAQTQLFDTGLNNGVLHQQEYDPLTGGLISNVYLDTLGTRTFQSITTEFSNGIKTHSRTINDNNTLTNADDTIVDQYYDAAGVIEFELTTDASPGGTGKPWVSVAREYVGGVTQLFRTTYDNLNQQVLGTAGSQEIEGGSGNDVLLGGASADSFVFAPGFGNDTVHDYLDGTDTLDFTAYSVDTRAELEAIASITTAGTATLISLNAGGSVKILNLAPGAIGDSDFVGVPIA